MPDERDSLRRQIKEAEENLRLIAIRKSEYVEETGIPLQLLREEKRKQELLAKLRRDLFRHSSISAARRALLEDDKKKIVSAILEGGCMDSDDACAAVVSKLSFGPDVEGDPHLFQRILKILNACLESPGGLEELADVLASACAEAERLRGLHNTLQALLPQPVDWARVAEVKALLKAVNVDRAKLEYYYLSCSKGQPLPAVVLGGDSLLFPLLDSLAKMTCPAPDEAPFLEFLQRLLQDIGDGAVTARLSDYMVEVAEEHNVDLSAVREKIERSDASPPAAAAPAYLMIKVAQSVWNPSDSIVKAWLHYADAFESLTEREGAYPLESLRDLIEEFIGECYRSVLARVGGRLPTGFELTVEVFLPLELLDCDVDQWKIKVGKHTSRPVGGHCRVVVRSLDRIYDPELWPTWSLWHNKWQARPRPPLRATDSHVFLASCDADYSETLYDHLRQRGTVFLALSPVPPARRPGGTLEVIGPMLDAGTPIALWLRQEDDDIGTMRKEVRDIVYGYGLDDIPGVVYLRRGEALLAEERQRLWNNLTLLWDDPERLPPDIRFGRLEKPKERTTEP